jgi:hypothetical protein
MKSSYTVPKLTVHGNVAEITQILGPTSRRDFVFLNGNPSDDAATSPDQGSRDVCLGNLDPAQPPANCDPRF